VPFQDVAICDGKNEQPVGGHDIYVFQSESQDDMHQELHTETGKDELHEPFTATAVQAKEEEKDISCLYRIIP
jgi:hypothetical protein